MGRRRSRRELELDVLQVQEDVLRLAHRSPSRPAHLGGSLSAAGILVAALTDVMELGRSGERDWDARDRLVLSKGHAALALYPTLVLAGLMQRDDLLSPLHGPESLVPREPSREPSRGIEISGGSLGMGLGYGCGLALAARRRGLPSRTFVLMGDGECDEGSVWEAAALIGHERLGSLTAVVDANGLQLDGPTEEVLGTCSRFRQFESFGFEAVDVDGSDVVALRDALLQVSGRPRALIVHTTKGQGVSFMEGRVEWHDHPLSDSLFEQAMAELAGERDRLVAKGCCA